MSATSGGRSAGSGAARALPTGRLTDFEDDPAPDMATLLSPRARRPDATPDVPAGPDAAGPPAQELLVAPAPGQSDPEAEQATVSPPTGNENGTAAAAAAEDLPATGPDVMPAAPAGPSPPAAAPARRNRIKPSTVHVPARLMPAIRTDRENTSRSNGELVIAAIEGCHAQLAELLGRRPAPTGGALFASRASRGARLSDGDLTPLNVRLYEADWEVIDTLVAQYQAFSRGHLISTALLHFFDLPSRPQDQ